MTTKTAATLFESLPGTWSLRRSINGSHTAEIRGKAVWRKQCTQYMQLLETVQTHTDKQCFESTACYHYKRAGHLWQIYTQPPHGPSEPLHTIDFNTGSTGPMMIAASPHFCKHDRYYAYYDFNQQHTLRIVFTVHGPHKHYTSITELKKLHT